MILFLLSLLFAPSGAIEADVRGTAEPLEVQLLRQDDAGRWQEVRQRSLPAGTRHLRFDALDAGVYQILVRGTTPTERLATRVHLASGETRAATIRIEPLTLAGHVTHGGADLDRGALLLQQKDDQWQAPVHLASDGTFLVQVWQRGTFLVTVRAPSLAAPYTSTLELEGAAPLRVAIDVPGGRVHRDNRIAVKFARR